LFATFFRDRKRIKERIAEKRRQRLENSAYDNYSEIANGDQNVSLPNISIEVQLNQSPVKSKRDHKSASTCSETIQTSPVRLNVPKNNTRETVPPWNYIPNDKATKNVIRRNSYDMAIGRYTVLCSKYGGDPVVNGTNSYTVAYENSAFNCNNTSDVVL
jgi:hypothetical protein